jgi:hypothetical protein
LPGLLRILEEKADENNNLCHDDNGTFAWAATASRGTDDHAGTGLYLTDLVHALENVVNVHTD